MNASFPIIVDLFLGDFKASFNSNLYTINNNLVQSGIVHLEPFYTQYLYSGSGYSTSEAVAEYVFANSDGNKIIVVSRAYEYSPGYWGIEIIDRNWK